MSLKTYLDDDGGISIKSEDAQQQLFNQCSGDKFLQQQQNGQNHLLYDTMIASKHDQQQNSTVDMSAIDPIIVNYGLMSMHQKPNGTAVDNNCSGNNPDSILTSNSDSLLTDIDMIS
jgi:hypothetical protein